jgi:hypothetical protein
MATEEDQTAPAIRFKRRKIAHPRKRSTDNIAPSEFVFELSQAPNSTPPASDSILERPPHVAVDEHEEPISNLKEILRQRKRPQERLREAARKAAEKKTVPLVQIDGAAPPDQYSGRFVAQTGQVVDKDDANM